MDSRWKKCTNSGESIFSSTEIVSDFDRPALAEENGTTLPMWEFNSPVSDLVPGETYHLMLDFDDLPVAPHGGVLGLTNSAIGANGGGVHLATPDNPTFPLQDSEWRRITEFFSHGEHVQMRVVADGNPYETVSHSIDETYTQTFDSMSPNGERGFLPAGWAYFDEIVTNVETDPADDEAIYNTYLTHAFPPELRLHGPTLFNAGVPGETDRALAIGTHRRSNEATLQFVTELTGGSAQAVELSFDLEVWESDRSRDNPGEAAFDVVLDVDTGDGFEQVMELGYVTTGASLVPASGLFVNGNEPVYSTSFNSGQLSLDLPEGALVRLRWIADLEAETRGWVYGLDNVSLGIFAAADSVIGDFDNDGTLSASDINLLAAEIREGSNDIRFDVNQDGTVDLDDHQEWVHSTIRNTYFGDANLDGEFNTTDLTAAFQAGEYEDGVALNSTWAEGDWNGDGDFDSGDLVAAFRDGGYEQGPRAATQAVPEPASLWIPVLVVALLTARATAVNDSINRS